MYTWNMNWIYPYESPWGIINKFLYVNTINGLNVAKELTTGRGRVIDTYRANQFHTGIDSNYEMKEHSWLTDSESIEEYGMNILKQLLNPLIVIQNSFHNMNIVCNLVIRKNLHYYLSLFDT